MRCEFYHTTRQGASNKRRTKHIVLCLLFVSENNKIKSIVFMHSANAQRGVLPYLHYNNKGGNYSSTECPAQRICKQICMHTKQNPLFLFDQMLIDASPIYWLITIEGAASGVIPLSTSKSQTYSNPPVVHLCP